LICGIAVGIFASWEYTTEPLIGGIAVRIFASWADITEPLIGGVTVGIFASWADITELLICRIYFFIVPRQSFPNFSYKTIYHDRSPYLLLVLSLI
jgi:hypothetical protein